MAFVADAEKKRRLRVHVADAPLKPRWARDFTCPVARAAALGPGAGVSSEGQQSRGRGVMPGGMSTSPHIVGGQQSGGRGMMPGGTSASPQVVGGQLGGGRGVVSGGTSATPHVVGGQVDGGRGVVPGGRTPRGDASRSVTKVVDAGPRGFNGEAGGESKQNAQVRHEENGGKGGRDFEPKSRSGGVVLIEHS